MMNGNQTSGDDHFVMNINVESQCWTPKAQITLYIKKKKKRTKQTIVHKQIQLDPTILRGGSLTLPSSLKYLFCILPYLHISKCPRNGF